ncbi:MAG: hypothetical protein WCK08_07075 [Betaproteobacteria bacterium]
MNPTSLVPRFFDALAAVALGAVLSACGGGGGGGGEKGPDPLTQLAVTRLQAGLFADALALTPSYPETVAMLTADQRWWAVRRDSASSASIFSGELSQDGRGAGSIAAVKGFMGSRLRSGSAAMSSVSEQGLSGRISLAAEPSGSPPLSAQAVDVAVSKPAAAIYSAAASADVSALNGAWVGTWIDGANSALVTLNFNAGSVSLPTGGVLNCQLTSASVVTAEPGVHLYRIALAFQPGLATCIRSDQLVVRVLSGVLAVYALPAGRQRLDLLAIDASGSGIVFRAER